MGFLDEGTPSCVLSGGELVSRSRKAGQKTWKEYAKQRELWPGQGPCVAVPAAWQRDKACSVASRNKDCLATYTELKLRPPQPSALHQQAALNVPGGAAVESSATCRDRCEWQTPWSHHGRLECRRLHCHQISCHVLPSLTLESCGS